ncbi:YrhK family protein [Neisseria sp.]|uniref:YrhK family protein n=1 Tax=Neisseria sp. TaxID=192066 RepID=UPI0026DCA757|nr:YrhK family protein [Neisseria sp.]MDO4906626.1 YrhK family protein [Neisseria sp.]
MPIFHPDNRSRSPLHKKIYAYSELAYTIVDFSAALLFVIGSILFFSARTTYAGTWLFLIGSVLFGLRPTIKLCREFAYLRLDSMPPQNSSRRHRQYSNPNCK